MGFIIREKASDPIVTLDDNGDGGVFVIVGDSCVVEIHADGTLNLCDYVNAEETGNLKLSEGKDDGWGGCAGRRARVFFEGKELTEAPKVEKPKTRRSKKTDKVIA